MRCSDFGRGDSSRGNDRTDLGAVTVRSSDKFAICLAQAVDIEQDMHSGTSAPAVDRYEVVSSLVVAHGNQPLPSDGAGRRIMDDNESTEEPKKSAARLLSLVLPLFATYYPQFCLLTYVNVDRLGPRWSCVG